MSITPADLAAALGGRMFAPRTVVAPTPDGGQLFVMVPDADTFLVRIVGSHINRAEAECLVMQAVDRWRGAKPAQLDLWGHAA